MRGRSSERSSGSLAQGRQVLCITHLPQIAVFADAQHAIRKNTDGSRASTTLESLKGEALVRELTMMLVGSQYSEASVKSVRELMQKSGRLEKDMDRESIILIGMPASGKSTVGKMLAKELGYRFIDLDVYIKEKDGRPLQDIIDTEGEAAPDGYREKAHGRT